VVAITQKINAEKLLNVVVADQLKDFHMSPKIVGKWSQKWDPEISLYGCFLKWWYPTTMSFPTKNDHFGVFWGYHHFRKPPYGRMVVAG